MLSTPHWQSAIPLALHDQIEHQCDKLAGTGRTVREYRVQPLGFGLTRVALSFVTFSRHGADRSDWPHLILTYQRISQDEQRLLFSEHVRTLD